MKVFRERVRRRGACIGEEREGEHGGGKGGREFTRHHKTEAVVDEREERSIQ